MATQHGEDWRYHACAELLEKHLQLQQKQVWIECLGVTQKGIFKDTYTMLPPTLTVKGKPASTALAVGSDGQLSSCCCPVHEA